MAKPSERDVRLMGRKVAERFAAIAPDTFESIVDEQGWDDETLILLVCGFVDRHDLSGALVAHLRTCADQENADTQRVRDLSAWFATGEVSFKEFLAGVPGGKGAGGPLKAPKARGEIPPKTRPKQTQS